PDPVAGSRPLQHPLGNGNSEPGPALRSVDEAEIFTVKAKIRAELKLPPLTQARALRKRRWKIRGLRHFPPVSTTRRLRPFFRRRLSTCFPSVSLLRFRKPCFRLRFLRLG